MFDRAFQRLNVRLTWCLELKRQRDGVKKKESETQWNVSRLSEIDYVLDDNFTRLFDFLSVS